MRALCSVVVLLAGCGARTPLADRDAPAGADASALMDLGAAADAPVVVDAPAVRDVVVADRAPPPPTDRPSFCGDGIVAAGEECDLGADNGPTDAFTLSQPGRPAVVVRPLARPQSAEAFYRYASASAHTGFEDAGLANHILYVDRSTGTLSIVFVAGRDGALGLMPDQPDSTVQVNWFGVPDGATVGVSDDAGELRAVGGGRFEGRWSFQSNSDGGVVQGLAWDQSWRIVAQTLRSDGITRSRFVGANGATRSLTVRDDVVLVHRVGDLCREDCRRPRCGDGQLDADERCDDGNTVAGDGCAADCRRFE
jgi:cysteine-rich repeat protein